MPLDEEELYQERIQEYYEEPYHRGRCSQCTHAHEDTNPLCGDVIRLELQIDDQGTLKEVYFNGDGCCISQAAASMLVEKFDGQPIEDVKKFTAQDMLDLFGVRLTPNRQKCCLLSWRVLQAALLLARPGQRRRRTAHHLGEEDFMTTVSQSTTFDPQRFRPDFPILARTVHGDVPLVYLDNAATSQRPRQVIEAIVDAYENHYANVHRGIHTLWPKRSTNCTRTPGRRSASSSTPPAKCREDDSPATTEQIIFTSGTTHSINLVARSWGDANVRPGDEILLSEMEHHSNLVPWYQLAERTGAVVRHIPLDRRRAAATRRARRAVDPADEAGGGDGGFQRAGHDQSAGRNHRPRHDVGAVVLVDGRRACRT